MKNNDFKDEKDAFWDIESLIPNRRPQTPPKAPARSVEATEIVIEPREKGIAKAADGEVKLNITRDSTYGAPQKPQIPDDEYSPEGSLIHRVRIYNWKTNYNYYEQFLEHARKIRRVRGRECSHVPYFSYVPQYSQLSRSQLDWYLWWRECAVKGEYLPTDYSYILLFIYEIINTGGHSHPRWGQNQLCGLWCAYRAEYPRLDRLLSEWICDFSLIHHLPAPIERLSKMQSDFTHSCTLREFYMRIPERSLDEAYSDEYCNILLTYCANYDYKKSKFAKGDTVKLYDKHIRGALFHTVKNLSHDDGQIFSLGKVEDSHIVRDAYAGALCSYEAKKRIEADYCSFSRSYELRFIVSDIVKYSENRLRAYLGVKSRLSVTTIPKNVKACVDEYFDKALPRRAVDADTSRVEETHDYDKFYDAPSTPVSSARASEIEAESWETTERLIAAFGEEEPIDGEVLDGSSLIEAVEPETEMIPEPQPEPAEAVGGFAEELGELFEFVKLAEQGDAVGQRRFAAERHEMIDFIADSINEKAVEIIGDVILEDCGGYYTFIEDYRKEVFQ